MSKQVGEVTFCRKVPVKPAMNPPCKPPRNSTWQLKNSEPPIEPASANRIKNLANISAKAPIEPRKPPIEPRKPPIVDDKSQIYSKRDK